VRELVAVAFGRKVFLLTSILRCLGDLSSCHGYRVGTGDGNTKIVLESSQRRK